MSKTTREIRQKNRDIGQMPHVAIPQLVVRPYNKHERQFVNPRTNESKVDTLARLMVAGEVDKRRFNEASQVQPRGVELAQSGHFDRLIRARDDFIKGYVNVFEITPEEHALAQQTADTSYLAILRDEQIEREQAGA